MRGLKIQRRWLRMILSGEKTMEVRSRHYKLSGRIALGNSNTGLVEGYCTVREVIKIPRSEISKYENQHHATEWLKEHYTGDFLYGFVLADVEREKNPFPYPKSYGVTFKSD